jgi:glycosyltransferase involved in cell wall biosynthesis
MKICVVSDYLPGFHKLWSGAELLAVTLGEMLQERSCEILFLTTPWDFEPDNNHDNVYAVKTPAKRLGTLSRNFPIDIAALWHLYRKLKSYKPDVVHINAKYLFLPTLIVCSKLNIPTVFTVPDYFIFCPTTFIRRPDGRICTAYHGPDCYDCLSALHNGRAKKLVKCIPKFIIKALLALRAKEFNYFLRKIGAYIALTNISKNRMVEYGVAEEKVHVIYHYKLSTPKETNVNIVKLSAMFAGSLSEENGTEVLIAAFAMVAEKIDNAKLYLVGNGRNEFVEELKKQIAGYDITNEVIFVGKKSNDEVLSIISKCDVVVVPHQWPKEFGPIILLEAMALGKPVITSRIGATEEFVQDGKNGFLIGDYGSPTEFANKMQYLLDNPESARKMGKNGRNTVSFALGNSPADKLINLYSALLSPRRSGLGRGVKATSME